MTKKSIFLTVVAVAALSASVPSFSMSNKGDIFRLIEEKGDLQEVEKLVEGLSESEINNSDNVINFGSELGRVNTRETLLSVACRKNRQEIVQLLLSKGAGKSVEKPDYLGKTPIFFAIENGNVEIVKMLLNYCSKEFITMPSEYRGKTMLSYACEKDKMDIVQVFMEKFAQESIEMIDCESKSPLYWACKNDNLELVKLLLKKGVTKSIDMVGSHGVKEADLMPIWWACKNNNKESVKLLLEKTSEDPVKIKIRYFENAMPLHPAIENGNLEIVRLLLVSGASVVDKSIELANGANPSIELAKNKQKILEYLNLARDYDTAQNKMQFISSKEQDADGYNLLVKRSFSRNYTSDSCKKLMFDTLRKQVGCEKRYKKLQDCCVKTVK